MNPLKKKELLIGSPFIALGVTLFILKVTKEPTEISALIIAFLFILVGASVALNMIPKKIKLGNFSVTLIPSPQEEYIAESQKLSSGVQQKVINEEERREKEEVAKSKSLPGSDADHYQATDQIKFSDVLIRPSAYPMTPMYLLDKNYLIIDWNEAFSLAFDRTMEGQQGKSVLDWTYHLENYEEVLDHGTQVFADPNNLPNIDIETIVYQSLRYGKLTANKRAYRIPDDQGECIAWLVTMELSFDNPEKINQYRYELLRILGLDLMWSEYSISYDKVLNQTNTYNKLLDDILGVSGKLHSIPNNSRILDLGAGTGNITSRLVTHPNTNLVYALDNNRVMLDFLRDKCQPFLRDDDNGNGVIAIKQDVTSLRGIPDNYFDFVIANNVFYALADPESSINEVFRVLKPGGELRMSGPRKDSSIKTLFSELKKDLVKSGKYSSIQTDFEHVLQINELKLNSMLFRWTTPEFTRLLESAQFEDIHSDDRVYAGQSMMVVATKPASENNPEIIIPGKPHEDIPQPKAA